jgi:hypothetical protein
MDDDDVAGDIDVSVNKGLVVAGSRLMHHAPGPAAAGAAQRAGGRSA